MIFVFFTLRISGNNGSSSTQKETLDISFIITAENSVVFLNQVSITDMFLILLLVNHCLLEKRWIHCTQSVNFSMEVSGEGGARI